MLPIFLFATQEKNMHKFMQIYTFLLTSQTLKSIII